MYKNTGLLIQKKNPYRSGEMKGQIGRKSPGRYYKVMYYSGLKLNLRIFLINLALLLSEIPFQLIRILSFFKIAVRMG